MLGRKNLSAQGREVPNPLGASAVPKVIVGCIVAAIIIAAAFLTGIVNLTNLATVVTGVIVLASIAMFAVILSSRSITKVERSRVFAFIPMFIASFAFFSLFQQIFTVIEVYAAERVDLTVGGFHVLPAWFQSVDPVGIIIFAPIFATLWSKLGNRQPNTPMKFSIGLFGMGVCFLLFLTMIGSNGRPAPPWPSPGSCCCSASPS